MTTTATPITSLNCPTLKTLKTGKVRQIFEAGENLVLVATDRVSAFDSILPDGIPHKGRVLTEISEFWFGKTKSVVENHLITSNFDEFPTEFQPYRNQLEGRSMLVKRSEVFPVECVVRSYLVGSGYKEYKQSQTVCGISLPKGLQQASKLPELLFTPATKADSGHDENISFDQMANLIGIEASTQLKDISLNLFKIGQAHALEKGIILADTKFEFGLYNGKIILIDEVMTPDSSRFWSKSEYKEGISPPSFDKQIIRDHLEASGWDKNPPAPHLPADIIRKTSEKYLEVESLLLN